jgi:nitrile hydratase
VHALYSLARKLHIFNIDEYRHAIERMAPRHYVAASYYERVLTGTATLCVEKGLISAPELGELAGGEFPLAHPLGPGRSNRPESGPYAIGDVLRVSAERVPGHVRIPGYVRGKTGVVVGISPLTPFADASAHGMEAPLEPTYRLRFAATDLWPGDCESADVYVDLFQSYLDPV